MESAKPHALTFPDLSRLRRNLSDKDELPSLSKTIQRLLALDPEDGLSAQDLARIILEDHGLISRVLQRVNSFYFNRVGKEITTVTQAVVLLGFDRVREIALGMAHLLQQRPLLAKKVQ